MQTFIFKTASEYRHRSNTTMPYPVAGNLKLLHFYGLSCQLRYSTGFLGVSYSDLMIEQGYRTLFLTLKIALSFVKLRI